MPHGWKRHKKECKHLRKNWEKRNREQINVGALLDAKKKGGGVGGVGSVDIHNCYSGIFISRQ